MEAINFVDITVSYQHKTIFSHFSAVINQGEFVGVFGPNGAGKSTLFRAILGLIPLTHGEIKIFGFPIIRGHEAIGYMPQNRNLQMTGNLSGRERLILCAQAYRWGLPNISEPKDLENILTLVEAQAFANQPFRQLSGGEKQRLLLAQALIANPKILLLDEPLLNLDPYHQEKMIELIARIQKQLNITVLLSSHALNPLLNVMDRVIYLAHGNAAIGTVDEVVNPEKLSWLYGYPVDVIKHGHRIFIIGQDTEINDHDTHH